MALPTRYRIAATSLLIALSTTPAPTSSAFAADGQWSFSGSGNPALSPIYAYDSARRRLVGVLPDDGYSGGTSYVIRFGPPVSIQPLTVTGNAAVPGGSRAIYDPVRDRLVVHGGTTVHQLDLTGATPTWSAIETTGPLPGHRTSHSAIYDPVGDRMIVFGGLGPSPHFNSGRWVDVWALSLSGTPAWTDITPPLPPEEAASGLADHAAIYDPVRHRMVVYGGSTRPNASVGTVRSVWALSLSGTPVWSTLSTTGFAVANPSLVYDPAFDRLITFGGRNAGVGYLYDYFRAYSFDDGWSTLLPDGTPPTARFGHAGVWNPHLRQMIVYGGNAYAGAINEVWLWRAPEVLDAGDGGVPLALAVRPVAAITHGRSVDLRCSFPAAGLGELEVWDVGGRRLARQLVAVDGAGTQMLRVDLPAGSAPGVRYVGLTQGGQRARSRFVLLR